MSLGCMVSWREINGKMTFVSNFDAIRLSGHMCLECINKPCKDENEMVRLQANKGIYQLVTRCNDFRGRG